MCERQLSNQNLIFSLSREYVCFDYIIHDRYSFSYPEPFLRAVNGARQGALAKSISNWHLIGYNEGYCSNNVYILLPCFYGIRFWIWPEPLVAPRVRRALGTRMDRYYDIITETQVIARNSRWRRANVVIQMEVTAGIFLASILLKEMRYLVYIRYLWYLEAVALFQLLTPSACNNTFFGRRSIIARCGYQAPARSIL